ncbi:hypothetical protein RF11_08705 [Thelohanellus kitauei]|uniref:ISXO2-like transposase domain-containing protein n=1 Tax=Thelohanellus kitauei TaxID=669202 RepID=A0A0C2N4C8_THEKT|nr:hypothetical protein RF11_08705 [Thelohanellus kitauei]
MYAFWRKKKHSELEFDVGDFAQSSDKKSLYYFLINNYIRNKTIIKLYRDFMNPSFKIGGAGAVVEVDEAKFCRPKYHREYGTAHRKRVFIPLVLDRSADTLKTQIFKRIEIVGTTMITDNLGRYLNLEDLGYIHQTVVHQDKFFDPMSENMSTTGARKWPMSSYILEYIYTMEYYLGVHPTTFQGFLEDAREIYKPYVDEPHICRSGLDHQHLSFLPENVTHPDSDSVG